LNRGGVRLGTAEFYSVVEALPQILDSLVVHIESASGGLGELILFVAAGERSSASQSLRDLIVQTIRKQLSPRHVPDSIYFVSAVPRTLSGKKLEVPVKKIIQGAELDSVVSRGTVADIRAIEDLLVILQERKAATAELYKLQKGTSA
jgi:acetoacetyl-CoA synthetase